MATTWPDIVSKLSRDAEMLQRFNAAGFDQINEHAIKAAIVAYERQLVTPNSRFDRYLKGEESAITESEKNGFELFTALGCISCHQGKNVGGNMFQRFGVYENFYARHGEPPPESLGRYNVTGEDRDIHVFKVPSLRNVSLTAPYFHDGSVGSLSEAVTIMAKYQLGLELEEQQIIDLVAFLTSLEGQVDERLK